MSLFSNQVLRTLAAGTVFWMALVLTPRAWVGDVEPSSGAEDEVPVRVLDEPDDCLWCESETAEPANCSDDNEDRPVWLNPDDPSEQTDSPPCEEESDDSPSA